MLWFYMVFGRQAFTHSQLMSDDRGTVEELSFAQTTLEMTGVVLVLELVLA